MPVVTGLAFLIVGGLLAGSGFLAGSQMAGRGSDAIYNSSHVKKTIVNSLSNIEIDNAEATSSLITAVTVTLSFIAAAIICCNCFPHTLGFMKARQLHKEKVLKLERLQSLLEEQLNESKMIVSSVKSLFTTLPSAPPLSQIQIGQGTLPRGQLKPKYLSTSCLDRYKLPTLQEDVKEEV